MITLQLAFLLQESELMKKWGKLADLKKQVMTFWIWNDMITTSGILLLQINVRNGLIISCSNGK